MISVPRSSLPGKRDLPTPEDEELRRERELVRSAGMISRSTMAMAFGIVFLLMGIGLAVTWRLWPAAIAFGLLGAISIGWSVYAMCRR